MDRTYILNNVGEEHITVDILFEAIIQGIVTLDDLIETQQLGYQKRRQLQNELNSYREVDNTFWEQKKSSVEGCREYLEKYPTGLHASEANQKLQEYAASVSNSQKKREDILNSLRVNPNRYSIDEIRDYIKQKDISESDLIQNGIPDGIVKLLHINDATSFNLGMQPEGIPDGFTEVYLWGTTGSGKSSVLAATLSAAHRHGQLLLGDGPGFRYMDQLKDVFLHDFAFCPPATSNEKTQYLPFSLLKEGDQPRSVSLIEMSGEVFKCFYLQKAGENITEPILGTFNQMKKLLSSNNRKIHFFLIDCEKVMYRDNEGRTQANYLDAAAAYFDQYDIFKKHTNAIYIVLTKSDLIERHTENKASEITRFLRENNYLSFINSLKLRCQKNCINDGKLICINFSIGKVFFNALCHFNDSSAQNFNDILFRRIKPTSRNILDVLNT